MPWRSCLARSSSRAYCDVLIAICPRCTHAICTSHSTVAQPESEGQLVHWPTPAPLGSLKRSPRLLAGGEGSSLSFQRTQSHSRPSRSQASAIWTSLYTAVPLCRSWICHCDSAIVIIIIIIIITITISSSSSILVPDMSAITD